jgi:hypothetical protein
MLFRDDLNMPSIPGINIQKGIEILVLIDLVAGNLAVDYFTKNTHITEETRTQDTRYKQETIIKLKDTN